MNGERPRVVDTAGGVCVIHRGRHLYSRFDASALPRALVARLEPLPRTLYLVPSPLAFHGVPELAARLPESSAVLCAELDPELLELASGFAPGRVPADGRVVFPATVDPEAVIAAAGPLGRFRRVVELRLSGGRDLRPSAYDALFEALRDRIASSWRNRSTLCAMSALWTRNILRNLGGVGNIELRALPRVDGPVIVLGAGPSLDDLPSWPDRRRPYLLAADTALPALLGRGIVPDCVVCLEGQVYNLADFHGLRGRPLDLVIDASAHPSAFRRVRGPKRIVVSRWDDLTFLDRLAALPFVADAVPPLGSVGVLALRVALDMTDGPVFVSGLDFSFAPGRTHARGSPSERAEERRENRLYGRRRQWEASFGPRAKRSGGLVYDSVLESYAAGLADLARGTGRVYDLRRGGLELGLPRAAWTDCAGGFEVRRDEAFDRATAAAAARGFLAGLGAGLERLYGLLKRGGSDSELRLALAESSWMYAAFPDADRAPELAQDFLNRALVAVAYWDGRVRDAIDDIDGCGGTR